MLNTDFNGRGGVGNPRGLTHTSSLHLVRRPGPGSARGRGSLRQGRVLPGVDPHCRGGETHFSSLFLMCFAPSRVVTTAMPCPHGRQRYRCRVQGVRRRRHLCAQAATRPLQGVRCVACVKYASVCISQPRVDAPRGRNSHGRRPARSRPGSGLSTSHVPGTTFIVSPRGFPTPPRPRASAMPT